MRATLKLIRFPLFTTALADSAAGYMIAVRVASDLDAATVLLLAGASAFLYCAGMALNDVADRGRDCTLHPGRPIPSGAIGTRHAAMTGAVLLLAGCGCAAAIGPGALTVAGAIAFLILLYDFSLKRFRLTGPVTMGLVRAGNMAMGMTAARPLLTIDEFDLMWVVLIFGYITLATLLSTCEEGRAPRPALLAILAAIGLLICVPPAAASRIQPEGVAFAVILLAVLAWRAAVLLRRPTTAEISATVGFLILGIVPLNASILLAMDLPISCMAILALLPISLLGLWSFKRV